MATHTLANLMKMAATFARVRERAPSTDDRQIVATLDLDFQAAVKINDAKTMDRILHNNMVLILGDGRINTREELLQEARQGTYMYERQEEDAGSQTVRVWGDTAVVTALLWVKGVANGTPFNRRLWFSDTYARTPEGWRYVFGQASLRLPDATVGAKGAANIKSVSAI